jgi:urease accessory protein
MSWLAWQLADSAFPTGAFAHSSGLEAAQQSGGLACLETFVAAALHQQATTALPLIGAVNRNRSLVDEADALWEAITSNHVANRASRGIGQAMLATAAKSLGCEELVLLRRRIRRAGMPGHQPVIYGAVTGSLGMPATEAQRLYLFTAARDLISSAIRLGIIGPTHAQACLRRAERSAQAALRVAAGRDWRQPASAFPLQDLQQGLHDRLYFRLFHS